MKEITQKVYEAISFDKGSNPSYEKLKACFIDEGLFINNKGDSPMIKSVDDYIAFIKEMVNNKNILSLSEKELKFECQVIGKVASITSSYQLDFETQQGSMTRYGVNLFQLIFKDGEWLISSMCWDDKEDKSLIL